MKVLTVGSIAFDTIRTPFGSRERALGGSATYFALAMSYFTPVMIVSVVGDDFGEKEEAVFKGRTIDTLGVEKRAGKTFFWECQYDYDLGERKTLATDLNVFADFKPVLPLSYRDADIVFLGNIDPEIQLDVLNSVSEPITVGCDTMNYWIETKRDALAKVLKLTDILLINESEVRQLANEPNILRAATKILPMGPKYLIVKRGEYGVLAFSKGAFFAIPAFPVEDVIDPTGAGDTFAGGFFGYLAQCERFDDPAIRQASVLGSAMGSFCVEAFGPDALLNLHKEDIVERFRAFKQLTQFDDIK